MSLAWLDGCVSRELYGGDTPPAGPPLELPESGHKCPSRKRKQWQHNKKVLCTCTLRTLLAARVPMTAALQAPSGRRSSVLSCHYVLSQGVPIAGRHASFRAGMSHTIPLDVYTHQPSPPIFQINWRRYWHRITNSQQCTMNAAISLNNTS